MSFRFCLFFSNALSTNFTKWSNTLKQFVGNLPTNILSVFGHFVGLALKGLIRAGKKYIYLLLFVCIVKSLYFPRWNSKWYEKLIFSFSIFNLKQDFWFLEKSKSEIVISVAYGNFFIQWLLFCFI